MSRPRFLADHDLNEQIVTGVLRREPSLECVRARDIGMSERSDAEVLAYAAEMGSLSCRMMSTPCRMQRTRG